MTQFHEGEEVECLIRPWADEPGGRNGNCLGWRKAKIVRMAPPVYETTLGLFDAAHIRAVSPLDEHFSRAPTTEDEHQTVLAGDSAEEYPGLAEPDDDTSEPMGHQGSP